MKSLALTLGSLVLVDLQSPKEKYWGSLLEVNQVGIWIKGLNVDVFDRWLKKALENPDEGMDVETSFFPMTRVERIRLDKDMRGVSYAEIFEQTLGRKPTELLHRKTEMSITIPIGKSWSEIEGIVLFKTLELAGNNKAEAARILGLDVKTIRNKLKMRQTLDENDRNT